MAPEDQRSRARVKDSAVEVPRGRRVDLRRLLPSGPSLLAGFSLLVLGVAAYGVAHETGLFAIRRIEVVGAPPGVGARVGAALEPLEGRSLVGLHAADLDRRIVGLPDVIGVTHDRAFPHTLRVYVLPERALLVLRRGQESWLVSARARVVRPLERGALPGLPRIWVPREVEVGVGDTLADGPARRAVRVLVLARDGLPARVRAVKLDGPETTLVLRSGIEVRLGREHDLRLKLAVAAEVLPRLADGSAYVDVAVPDRPVAGSVETQAQLEVDLGEEEQR
jgi:cell division septal protein FtsQ